MEDGKNDIGEREKEWEEMKKRKIDRSEGKCGRSRVVKIERVFKGLRAY